MSKFSLLILLCYVSALRAQDSEGNFLTDQQSGCKVWFKHTFTEDSVSWSGNCREGMAEGVGTIRGFTKGKPTAVYTGVLHNGKPEGEGEFSFGNGRKLKGFFIGGEPLFLSPELRTRLDKNLISETDSMHLYDGDNDKQQLYYHALVPLKTPKAVIVLMPGTWETTEHLLSSMSRFCELAMQYQMAVIVPSINQRITLTNEIVDILNTMFNDATIKYNLPDEWVMGGWSMGGLFSLRYTELANQDSTKTVIHPKAVFSCDGPCDLKNIYYHFKKKLNKNPGLSEPAYGIRELEKYCNGNPQTSPIKYEYYSCYSHDKQDGGNAKYLSKTPVRIYADVDPVWWMENRNVDMYDLNALDQTAMIQYLRDQGNTKAEFINAFGKGYRLEGNRHPHSWSIVEPEECINWIMQCMNLTYDNKN